MRILLVTPSAAPGGGAEIVCRASAEALAAAGDEVLLLHGGAGEVDIHGVTDRSVPGLADKMSITARGLEAVGQAAADWRADVVDVQLVNHLREPERVRSLARRVAVVLTIHNHACTCANWFRVLARTDAVCTRDHGLACLWYSQALACRRVAWPVLIKRWRGVGLTRESARAAHGFIVLDEYMKQTLVQAGCRPDRIHIVPPIIEPVGQEESPTPPADPPMVLFVGRLSAEKGVDLLLRAEEQIQTPHRLVITGDGEDRPRLERVAQIGGHAERVEFSGWAAPAQLDHLYAQAAVVVTPSHWAEPFGRVGPEAMARGRPVIAFDAGGISSWLSDGETGFLVRPFDVQMLAARIETLLQQPDLLTRMGTRAREIARSRFEPGAFVESARAAYSHAIKTFEAS